MTDSTFDCDKDSSMGQATVTYGRCPMCGYLMSPILPQLPCGHAAEPELEILDDDGVVYSHTRVWDSEDDYTDIAMADFLHGRLRVSAPVEGTGGIAIGDAVRVVPGIQTPYALRRETAASA